MAQQRRASHQVEAVPGGVRILVSGEIDLAVADDLQKWITEAVDSHPGADIDVDFSAVTFLESTGIRALVLAHRTAVEAGSRMRVTGTVSRVRMVLKMTGVYELLCPAQDAA